MANEGSSSSSQTEAEKQISFAQYYNIWATMDLSYMFVTIPDDTFLELPPDFNRIPQLLAGGYYNCLDLQGNMHEWGLIQARGARTKELLVYMGWLEFVVKNRYVPGDKLMVGFSRRLQTFFLVLDSKHPI